jgi:hypothetical protein
MMMQTSTSKAFGRGSWDYKYDVKRRKGEADSRIAGAKLTKCFHNFSMIIPSTILLQANPDAPNSFTRGTIVEEWWKNCRKI